jgi:hypothetical protein
MTGTFIRHLDRASVECVYLRRQTKDLDVDLRLRLLAVTNRLPGDRVGVPA